MNIKPNASPQEITSPFFKANEEFCHDFERFIARKKGKVKGRYNARSYSIYGKIETPKLWNVHYKRAIYSSTRSLISIFNKNEVLFTSVKWTCTDKRFLDATFCIRRKQFLDFIKPAFTQLEEHENYVVHTNGSHSSFFSKVVTILQPLFESEAIYQIKTQKNSFVIELRSDQHHFNILDELLLL